MKANFSPKFIRNPKAQSSSGKLINITIFSEYRPEEARQKAKAIWASDVLRIDDENEVIDFLDGSKTFNHPKTKEIYTVLYDQS